MIPVLQALLEQNPTTEYAYLCDPCVQHVSRLPKEGMHTHSCFHLYIYIKCALYSGAMAD